MCKFSIFVMVTWPLFGTLQGLYLPNAWSQTLQTSKRHTFRVSVFHWYHWFGIKLFPVGCAQDSRRVTLKRGKNAVFGSGSAHATKFRNFSRQHPSSPPIWWFAPPKKKKIVAIRRLHIGFRVRYKYYKKNIVVLVWPGAAHAPIAV